MTTRRYPAPRTTSPADAARLAAWTTARRAAGLSPIARCEGCHYPASACACRPLAWRASAGVAAALHSLGLAPSDTALETAWRVAIVIVERPASRWEDSYTLAAAKGLALALAAGDLVAAEAKALWLTDPGVAMTRALAARPAEVA